MTKLYFNKGVKMKRTFILLFVVLTAVLFNGCGHSNELAKFDVNNSKVLFRENVGPNARYVKIEQQSTAQKENKNGLGAVLDVIASVSNSVLAEEKQNKLRESIDTERLLYSISDNLQEAMHIYLDINPVEKLSDKPDFICTIVLKDCKLLLNQNQVSIYVNATASLVDRATGEIAWKNYESRTISLSESYGEHISDSGLESVFNALQLASLDENEINEIVDAAADDVGTYMAETLRNDVAKSHKQRMEMKRVIQ